MALTEKQKTEILKRFGSGERPRQIVEAMNISNRDLREFQKEAKKSIAKAWRSKPSRLARLRRNKRRLEDTKDQIEINILNIEYEIKAVENEE